MLPAEGDAFQVAFKDVQHAVLFCMEVQYQVRVLPLYRCMGLYWCATEVGCLLCSPVLPSLKITKPEPRCLPATEQMMELEWPREVLRLGPCKEVKAPDGSLIYRGPRIRMAVHWAAEGTVVQRLHQITKHRVFSGPAFQVGAVPAVLRCSLGPAPTLLATCLLHLSVDAKPFISAHMTNPAATPPLIPCPAGDA